jgi:uncharacterized membrane protein YcaP (DUF421 family)
VRSAGIYAALLIAFRLFGKREIGQFTIFDLVLVLLVANAVQPAMTGPDNSLLGGLIIIATLVALNFGVAQLDRIPRFHRIFISEPTVIIKDGRFLTEVMDREGLDREEAEMAIREHGLLKVSEVELGVLEPDGSISIIGKDTQTRTRTRRRLRRRFRIRG